MKTICTITTLLFFTAISLFSQETKLLKKSRQVDIFFELGELKIEENNSTIRLFQGNQTLRNSDAVYYSRMEPLIFFEALTKVPKKKGKFKKVYVSVTENKDIVEPGIFYGGHKVKEFVYPSVMPGAIGVLNYTTEIHDPHLINSFYFDDRFDVDESSFSVSYPEKVEIAFNLFNTEGLDLTETLESKGKNTVRTWKVKGLKRRTYNSKSPETAHFAPHIILRIKSYDNDGEKINISGNTDDLFKWYNSLIKKTPKTGDQQMIEEKVKELVEKSGNRQEKIETIYRWVQSNIKYIAFENGMAGFIPRAANKIFEKKYGDCKDMANLLQTMLNMADVPAYLTWIGTNSKPYSYEEVPCTITDNHMICAIKEQEEFIFLDPTNSFLKFGTPPISCQGKEAMIRIDDENYKIIKVPESAIGNNVRMDKLTLELENDILKGKVATILKGYFKEELQYVKMKREMTGDKNFLLDFLEVGKENSKYENIEIAETETNAALTFDGQFKSDVIRASDKLYVNLNLDPSSKEFLIDDLDTRIHPIKSEFKHSYNYACTFQIPAGYKLDFLPKNMEIDFEKLKISSKYIVEGNEVRFEKEIISNYLILPNEDFEDYKNFYSGLLKINRQKLILKEI